MQDILSTLPTKTNVLHVSKQLLEKPNVVTFDPFDTTTRSQQPISTSPHNFTGAKAKIPSETLSKQNNEQQYFKPTVTAPTNVHPVQASSSNSQILLDASLRTLTRKVDMAQKIEKLVGPKYGRVIGPSSNLPVAIKKRLEAYSRIDQRKEKLYTLLLHEHKQQFSRSK